MATNNRRKYFSLLKLVHLGGKLFYGEHALRQVKCQGEIVGGKGFVHRLVYIYRALGHQAPGQ